MLCLKQFVKKSSTLHDARFVVVYNGDEYCIDCIGDEKRIFISKDSITKETGTMLPLQPTDVKMFTPAIDTNNLIIKLLRDEGYDTQADILDKILK